MKFKRSEEDLGGLNLKQLLDLQPSAGTSVYAEGQGLKWLPDGSGILFLSGMSGSSNIWLAEPETGQIEQLTTDLGRQPFLSASLIDCSPDGRWLSFTGDNGSCDDRESSSHVELWLQETNSRKRRQITSFGANISSYSWAPDSQSIVLSTNRFGHYDIFVVELSTGHFKQLTNQNLYEVYPVFTPDGRNIVYVRLDESWKDHEFILKTVSGDEGHTVAKDTDFFDYLYGRRMGYPLISPDGLRLLYRSHRSGWVNYWQVPINGGEPELVFPENSDQSDATFSPNGDLAFVSNSNGTTRITILYCDNTNRVLVKPKMGVVGKPCWSPDSRQLAYLSESPISPSDLWLVDVITGKSRRLTSSFQSKAIKKYLVEPKKISYQSKDKLEISAYLYSPPKREKGERFPGMILVHGGPTAQFWDTYQADVQYFIRKGYVVLMPNIRGSTGYGKDFEDMNNHDWGHGDLQDVIAGVEYLKGLEYVDSSKMAIHGTSYGGCMSMSAVCFAPDVFQAAIPHAGYGDWLDFEDEQELRHRQLLKYKLGDIKEHRDVYFHCSPIYKVANVKTPVFLVHGEGRYPRSDASLKFARALEREYKIYEYKIYPNECYYVITVPNLQEMYPDIVDFMNRYLK